MLLLLSVYTPLSALSKVAVLDAICAQERYFNTLEMIENHKYLMDCVNDPEAHTVDSQVAAKMMESIHSAGGAAPDFFP